MPVKGANLDKQWISYSDVIEARKANEPAGRSLRQKIIAEYQRLNNDQMGIATDITLHGQNFCVIVTPMKNDQLRLVIRCEHGDMEALCAAFTEERKILVAANKAAKTAISQIVAEGPKAAGERPIEAGHTP